MSPRAPFCPWPFRHSLPFLSTTDNRTPTWRSSNRSTLSSGAGSCPSRWSTCWSTCGRAIASWAASTSECDSGCTVGEPCGCTCTEDFDSWTNSQVRRSLSAKIASDHASPPQCPGCRISLGARSGAVALSLVGFGCPLLQTTNGDAAAMLHVEHWRGCSRAQWVDIVNPGNDHQLKRGVPMRGRWSSMRT